MSASPELSFSPKADISFLPTESHVVYQVLGQERGGRRLLRLDLGHAVHRVGAAQPTEGAGELAGLLDSDGAQGSRAPGQASACGTSARGAMVRTADGIQSSPQINNNGKEYIFRKGCIYV